MIQVEGLRIETPPFQLGPIDLLVDKSDYCVLLGPSGSGKTTLLECIAGFRKSTAGRLHIAERDVSNLIAARRDVALVSQDAALFPHLCVRDNIAFALRLAKSPKAEANRRTDEVAEMLQVSHRLDSFPDKLSGGEARRVALARALVRPPSILLLDEPLSGVDPALHRELTGLLHRLHQELRLTVIHVTHHLNEARNLATHVGVIIDGKLEQFDSVDAVFTRPVSSSVARALTVPNFFIGQLSEDERAFRVSDDLVLPVATHSGAGMRARAHSLRTSQEANEWTVPGVIVGWEVSAVGDKSARVLLSHSDSELHVSIEAGTSPALGMLTNVSFRESKWELY